MGALSKTRSVNITASWTKRRPPTLKDYLLSKVYAITEGGCWLAETKHHLGYSWAHYAGRQRPLHRVSYEIFVGPIPPGKILRHTCDVRNCVYPGHLIPGTYKDNTRDFTERHPEHAHRIRHALAKQGTAAFSKQWRMMSADEKAAHRRKLSVGHSRRAAAKNAG
jgi:hypothetical protein